MRSLIVNADDFGLTKSTSEGIVKAYKDGIVSCISFFPAGEAFSHSLGMVEAMGLKEAGAHLSLTGGMPVTEPSKIPTLVARDKKFHKNRNIFFLKFFSGSINKEEIYTELKSQLDILKKTNIPVTNLSSHEHIHMLPPILDIFIRLAKEYGIKAIRCLHTSGEAIRMNPGRLYRTAILAYFGKRMKAALDGASIVYADHFKGFLDSGKLDEGLLLDMLKSLEEGTTELICHPGFIGPAILEHHKFHLNGERELFALTSPIVKKIIKERGIKLITYKEFIGSKTA